MAQRSGQIAILTPHAGHALLRAALDLVRTKDLDPRERADVSATRRFQTQDSAASAALLANIQLPPVATYATYRAVLG